MKNLFTIIFLSSICCSVWACRCPNENSDEVCEVDCSHSPCDDYTWRDIIKGLWQIPQSQTSLGKEFECSLLELLDNCEDTSLPCLLLTTLICVDLSFGFQPKAPASCVFNNLIEASVRYEEDECSKKALKDALLEYQTLVNQAIVYSIQMGLKAAGCPWEQMDERCYKECSIGQDFYTQLECESLPASLKEVVIKLSESDKQMDNNFALAVVASTTDSNLELFTKHMENSEIFMEVMKLKCCNVKIEEECYEFREKQLKDRITALGEEVGFIFDEIICDL